MESPTAFALQPPRFARLGDAFFSRVRPQPLPAPYWVGTSPAAASLLNLPGDWDDERHLHALTGNLELPGGEPLASVYSGHQFGVWAGQLGDGRALLLGDRTGRDGVWEVQLKGGGLTPYSRMGDGRAVLRSSIREFLASEAMHALGIPTTRALCVTGSPAPVYRETVESAAVVTRLAPSFVRFGHFEHFASQGAFGELRALADFVIDHFYPACRQAHGPGDRPAWHDDALDGEPTAWATDGCTNPYARLLEAVVRRTATLLASWQAVGFCHGVMNTDNMSILGLTLDYGPYQFLDAFDSRHICNHSDHSGRYAYARQPQVAYWNLHCLAQALVPLLDDTDQALAALKPYRDTFVGALHRRMNAKLGLGEPQAGDADRLEALLKLLEADRVDYPIFWRRLSDSVADGALADTAGTASAALAPVRDLFLQRDAFDTWAAGWRERARADGVDAALLRMQHANPRVVLRNHLAQLAIERAQAGDASGVAELLHALLHPHQEPADAALTAFPPEWASRLHISCSS